MNLKTVINWKKVYMNCEKTVVYLQQQIRFKKEKNEDHAGLQMELNSKQKYMAMLEFRMKESEEEIKRVSAIRMQEVPFLMVKMATVLKKMKKDKNRDPHLLTFLQTLHDDFKEGRFPDEEYENDAFLIMKNELDKIRI